jgi:hypothetical protein
MGKHFGVPSKNGQGDGVEVLPDAAAGIGMPGIPQTPVERNAIVRGETTGDGGSQGNESHRKLPPGAQEPARLLARATERAVDGPAIDPDAWRLWPILSSCLAVSKTTDGKERAGGEIRTVAKGPTWVSSLIMPEEGLQLSVAHLTLADAWAALERSLMAEPVGWTDCSSYARRRAKRPAPKAKTT